MTADADPYFKKIVTLAYRGQRLQFRVAQALFSSQEVDVGTQRLLRSLLDLPLPATPRILDLGCGYGPLGLALASATPGSQAHLVDRDALAVDFARQNAALNDLGAVVVAGGLGYAGLAAPGFDLIVSNIPAKAGERAIAELLLGAARHLRPAGLVAVVVVSRLEALVDRVLADPAVVILKRVVWPGHLVVQYRFTGQPVELPATTTDLDPYWHGRASVAAAGARRAVDTVVDVGGADGPDVATDLLVEATAGVRGDAPDAVLAFNVGQGYVPVALAHLLHPRHLALVDRDLLALTVARHNVEAHAAAVTRLSSAHQVGLAAVSSRPADLVFGCLRPDETQPVQAHLIEQAAGQVAEHGCVVIAGAATPIARIEAFVRARRFLSIDRRLRRKGHVALVLRHPGGPSRR